jgi:hypothetical protein
MASDAEGGFSDWAWLVSVSVPVVKAIDSRSSVMVTRED